MCSGTLYPITPLDVFTCLTTCWWVLHERIVCIGRCFARVLLILPYSVNTTNKSTLLSNAIWVAVEQSMSVTWPSRPCSFPMLRSS